MTQEKSIENSKPIEITKKVHKVNNKASTLRTYLPSTIVKAMQLSHQDSITWVLTTHDDHWQIFVKKATSSQSPQDNSDDHD